MAVTFVPDVFICNQDLWREAARQGIQCIMVKWCYGVRLCVYQDLVNSIEQKLYILGEIARTEISISNGPNS